MTHRTVLSLVIAQSFALLLIAAAVCADDKAGPTDPAQNITPGLHSANTDSIMGAVNDNQGMISINQAAGSLNNQANIRAVVLFPAGPLTHTSGANVRVRAQDNVLHGFHASRQDIIQGSFQNNIGVMGVNQAAGNMNQQSNSMVMGLGKEFALTDTELGKISAPNPESQQTADRLDAIVDSFTDTQGIAQVNQSAGDLNITGNNIVFTYREIHIQ